MNAEQGFYYCFGCQASGDAITFVREAEHLDFVDAVRFLADRAGLVLHEDTGGSDRQGRGELFAAMEKAVEWYHQRLLSAPDAGPARDYLRSRGYDGDVVRRFRLGWAPEGWDTLSQALDADDRVMKDAGLAFVNRRGRIQDAFRGRVIFPICDPSGRPLALGGRILPGRSAGQQGTRSPEPKYKNSQETPIYVKRRNLYALNWAKRDVVATGEVVVCEGYTDVIGFFKADVPRAVATCGTALGEEHFKLLSNFGRRIVLAYDADSAGQAAVARFYEWERRHQVDVVVASLPAGSDPADLARTDPDVLRKAVADARPFLQFRIERVWGEADLTTVEGRARAADAALRVVAEHPDNLVRDQYAMSVADRCRLDAPLVRQRLETSQASPSRSPQQPPTAGSRAVASSARTSKVADRPGLEALRFAVHHPELIADRLDASLFADDLQRRAFESLVDHEDLREAVDDAPPQVADLLRRVTVEQPVVGGPALADAVDAVVVQLVRGATQRLLKQVEAEVRASPADLERQSRLTADLKRWLEGLEDPATCRESASRLLAWLRDRQEDP